ncbi:hypothetical protein LR48_Vigan02g073600 [Vigna angularis]|uniref:Uncharacterized protein n=1 Tax=Phaseolus angularis TaxID=3914 RepID=A0A0L9TVS9_PHAAN|nr:hypothetical protein LR48_Vigan02g073600 [Vigna angularis]
MKKEDMEEKLVHQDSVHEDEELKPGRPRCNTVSRVSATVERQSGAATTISRLSATAKRHLSAATPARRFFGALSADDVGLDLFYVIFTNYLRYKNRLWVIKDIKENGVIEIEAPYSRRVKMVTRKLLKLCYMLLIPNVIAIACLGPRIRLTLVGKVAHSDASDGSDDSIY